MYVGETIGREAQAKASRISAKEADRTLKALLEKDKEGTRALIKARQASDRRKDTTKGTDSSSAKRKSDPLPGDSEEEEASSHSHLPRKNAYSADVIRKLGFDPTSKAGNKSKHEVTELQKKVNDQFHLFLPLGIAALRGVLTDRSLFFFIVGSIDGLPYLKTYRPRSQTGEKPVLCYRSRPKTRRAGFQARAITRWRCRITT